MNEMKNTFQTDNKSKSFRYDNFVIKKKFREPKI